MLSLEPKNWHYVARFWIILNGRVWIQNHGKKFRCPIADSLDRKAEWNAFIEPHKCEIEKGLHTRVYFQCINVGFLTSLVKQSLFKCCLDVLRQMRRRIRLKLFTTSGRHRSILGKGRRQELFLSGCWCRTFHPLQLDVQRMEMTILWHTLLFVISFFYKKSPGNYHFELFCILLAQAMFASQAAVDQLFSHQ